MLYAALAETKNACDVADRKVFEVVERDHFSLSWRQGLEEIL
jgi:hypothetical protein